MFDAKKLQSHCSYCPPSKWFLCLVYDTQKKGGGHRGDGRREGGSTQSFALETSKLLRQSAVPRTKQVHSARSIAFSPLACVRKRCQSPQCGTLCYASVYLGRYVSILLYHPPSYFTVVLLQTLVQNEQTPWSVKFQIFLLQNLSNLIGGLKINFLVFTFKGW